jgi:hypothetical protein
VTARVLAICAAAALIAFGVHETRSSGQSPVPTPADAHGLAGYCELNGEVDREGAAFLREQRDATPGEFRVAAREFLREQAPDLAELQGIAPAEVRADLRLFISGSRAFLLGRDTSVTRAEWRAAERRLAAFDRAACAS